jgi:hypothetical protein
MCRQNGGFENGIRVAQEFEIPMPTELNSPFNDSRRAEEFLVDLPSNKIVAGDGMNKCVHKSLGKARRAEYWLVWKPLVFFFITIVLYK